MKNLRKLATLLVTIAFAGMCFAPIEDMPPDKQFHPELSQAELERLQGSGTAAPTGRSSSAPEIGNNGAMPQNNTNAASMLSQGGNGGVGGSAEQSLKLAGEDQSKPEPKKGINLMLAGLFIMIGLAMVMGVRAYLDKTVPDAPTRKR